MIELAALCFGLFSWGLLLHGVIRRKHMTRLGFARMQAVSWAACSVALYLPSLSQRLEFIAKDYDGIIDCVSTFHLGSLVLLVVNAVLSVTVFLLSRESK